MTHVLESSLVIATVISTGKQIFYLSGMKAQCYLVGHLGTKQLAAASLGSMTANVAALSVIQGFVTALDTLCPQAWTSSNPSSMSLHCLRTTLILSLILIPQFLILWNASSLLLLLRQDAEVASLAGLYLKIISFGLPGYGVFETSRRWLQAQGLMLAPTYAVILVAPINIFLNWFLVWSKHAGLGFAGAPLATAISMNLMAVFTVGYCWLVAPRTGWGGFSKQILQDWGENWKLGVAGTAMVASEWYVYLWLGEFTAYR